MPYNLGMINLQYFSLNALNAVVMNSMRAYGRRVAK